MDDLKNVVIQTLEEEGTLGQLRAQLRARVFKAIEKNAEPAAKQAAGFQWQNPAAQKVHETEEARLVAHMIKEYLDFYRMEYTLSVYVPEAALSNQESLSREELQRKAGLQSQTQTPLLVQMLKQLKSGGNSQPGKSAAAPTTHL
jgi:FGFR1 oncogene partner